mmetsp:Transcript_14031/g.36138  ORF Transcript_14031/g.36138 Transcript_14031/m.36138 type:complete len:245 (-) Transcript_14031:395-1129(-)
MDGAGGSPMIGVRPAESQRIGSPGMIPMPSISSPGQPSSSSRTAGSSTAGSATSSKPRISGDGSPSKSSHKRESSKATPAGQVTRSSGTVPSTLVCSPLPSRHHKGCSRAIATARSSMTTAPSAPSSSCDRSTTERQRTSAASAVENVSGLQYTRRDRRPVPGAKDATVVLPSGWVHIAARGTLPRSGVSTMNILVSRTGQAWRAMCSRQFELRPRSQGCARHTGQTTTSSFHRLIWRRAGLAL